MDFSNETATHLGAAQQAHPPSDFCATPEVMSGKKNPLPGHILKNLHELKKGTIVLDQDSVVHHHSSDGNQHHSDLGGMVLK